MAQWERVRIGDRTRTALAALKARGKRLGKPENFTEDARKMGPEKIKQIADSNPNNQKARKVINLLNKDGKTLREIAIELNDAGFRTSKGKQFRPEQVRRLINK